MSFALVTGGSYSDAFQQFIEKVEKNLQSTVDRERTGVGGLSGMMMGRVDFLGLQLDEILKIHSSIKLQVSKHDEPGLLVLESLRGVSTALLEAQSTPTHAHITEIIWMYAFFIASTKTSLFHP